MDNPLIGPDGASRGVRAAEGRHREADVRLLDAALERFAAVLERDLPGCPPGLARLPGAGAAGGLGAALLACGGAAGVRVSGWSAALTGLDAALDECDLVVTGEGAFDEQSLRGKVVAGVAGAARERGVPCVVLAGQVAPPARRRGRRGRGHRGVLAGRPPRRRRAEAMARRRRKACAPLAGAAGRPLERVTPQRAYHGECRRTGPRWAIADRCSSTRAREQHRDEPADDRDGVDPVDG